MLLKKVRLFIKANIRQQLTIEQVKRQLSAHHCWRRGVRAPNERHVVAEAIHKQQLSNSCGNGNNYVVTMLKYVTSEHFKIEMSYY